MIVWEVIGFRRRSRVERDDPRSARRDPLVQVAHEHVLALDDRDLLGGGDRLLLGQRVVAAAATRACRDSRDGKHDGDDRDAPEGAVAKIAATRLRFVAAG